ncbi:ABC transporter substrate-binding protein [Marinibaculum pumilum]|uniref:ABC transporter substrate-binding protein n=1 Tax=Marinibaculum pumilum TaxID=1766165 RepID=A0ABV7LAN0_9PROT
MLTGLLRTAAAAALLAAAGALPAQAADDPVRIAFITDMSGVYSDLDGRGGLEAITMAVEDAGGEVLGRKVEILSADHQSKADIASAQAREMVARQDIDLLLGGTNSAANLAMQSIMTEAGRPFISIGGTTPRLTGPDCTPWTIAYFYDTTSLARSVGAAATRSAGKTWYFLTADYTFGHSLEEDATAVVKQNGGEVLGSVRHPLGTTDFSAFLLSAQASGAEVLALANAGPDLVNAIKGAKEFGLTDSMKLASLLMFIGDIHALGLENTQGLLMTEAWNFNLSPEAQSFADRFYEKMGKMPNGLQAAEYSATRTYLRAVEEAGTTDPDAVMKKMKSMEIDDMYGKGYIREDGRFVHDLYLFRTKTPEESTGEWDLLELVTTVPGEEAFGKEPNASCEFASKQG